MKVHSGVLPIQSQPENGQNGFVQGRLMRSDDGTLVLKTRDGELPVRLLGVDLPLEQLMSLRIVGHEGTSLILSAGQTMLPEGTGDLLQSWGFEAEGSWREIATSLIEENLPITKENLINLERWLRIAEHRWGVKLDPRVVAFLMAKHLPMKAETLLLAIHRLFPELRKEFPPEIMAREPMGADPEDTKAIAAMLQEVAGDYEKPSASTEGLTWTELIRTEARMTPDGGELHWREESSDDNDGSRQSSVLLEIFPPDLGWVRTSITWEQNEFQIRFEVDATYLSLFQQAAPDWQNELSAKGFKVVVSICEQAPAAVERLKPVDRWA